MCQPPWAADRDAINNSRARFTHAPSLTPAMIPCFGADMRKLIWFLFLFATTALSAQQYDLVLEAGRVIDPETSLDAVRNVGIRDGKIARISAAPL